MFWSVGPLATPPLAGSGSQSLTSLSCEGLPGTQHPKPKLLFAQEPPTSIKQNPDIAVI